MPELRTACSGLRPARAMSLHVSVLFSTIRPLLVRLFVAAQTIKNAVKKRMRSKLSGMMTIGVILAVSGCMSPWSPGRSASSSVSVLQDTNPVSQATHAATADAAESLEPNASDLPTTTDEATAAVLGELQQIGAIDPAAQQKLIADLREAKPEDWPRIVQQFQSALAFREQLAAKESQSEKEPATAVAQASADSVYARQQQEVPLARGAVPQASTTRTPQAQGIPKVVSAMLGDSTVSRDALAQHFVTESTAPSQPPPSTSMNRKPTVIAAAEPHVEEQVSHTAPIVSAQPAGSSQEHLQAAITSMEQSTQEPPASVEDVQQHMRLRLLRLLAGQEGAAVSPIPGASSTQQDYWSKQLFAISTYLDSEQQPDVKRRAAGSLIHLDSARTSLAELATLRVSNLTFVDSVDGFGVYKEHEEAKFRPGEQVTLYTEVENFRSQSSREGFHTKLSTSYEVLDMNGTRVDGAQFPDVEDLCKNQRRDFHMQYGVALPTHIYAGQYKLQLTITDQHSQKIGQTSVPFEIVE